MCGNSNSCQCSQSQFVDPCWHVQQALFRTAKNAEALQKELDEARAKLAKLEHPVKEVIIDRPGVYLCANGEYAVVVRCDVGDPNRFNCVGYILGKTKEQPTYKRLWNNYGERFQGWEPEFKIVSYHESLN